MRLTNFIFVILFLLISAHAHGEIISSLFDEPALVQIDTAQAWPLYKELLNTYGDDPKALAAAYALPSAPPVLQKFTLKISALRTALRTYIETVNMTPLDFEAELQNIAQVYPAWLLLQAQHHQYSPLIGQFLIEQTVLLSDTLINQIPISGLASFPFPALPMKQIAFSKLIPPYVACVVNDQDCPNPNTPTIEDYDAQIKRIEKDPSTDDLTKAQLMSQLMSAKLSLMTSGDYFFTKYKFRHPDQVNHMIKQIIKGLFIESYLAQEAGSFSLLGRDWLYGALSNGLGFRSDNINKPVDIMAKGPLSPYYFFRPQDSYGVVVPDDTIVYWQFAENKLKGFHF